MGSKSNSSRIGTAVLVVLVVVGLTVPLFVAADSKEANEPNDVQEAATPIEGTSIDGELTKQGGVDWYSKEFSAGDTVSFALTKSLWDKGVELSLHAPNGTELDTGSAYRGVAKTKLSATASQSGEYALKIKSVDEEIYGVQYTVHAPASEAPAKEPIELKSGTQQDNESNDNRSKAQPITHEKITGELDGSGDTDWYTLQVKEGQKISLLFTKEKGYDNEVYNQIYPPGVYDNFLEDVISGTIKRDDTRTQVVITPEKNGSLDIETKSAFDKSGGYTIQITKTQQSDSSSGSGDETADNTNTSQSSSPTTPTEESDSQSKTQHQNTETSTTTTTDDGDQTSLFGPGFTGPTALVALFVTALFALRRRGSV